MRDQLSVTPLDGAPFGAAVELHCSPQSITTATSARLVELLATHHLLVFECELSEDDHIALVSQFGRVLPQGPRVVVNDEPHLDAPTVTFVSNVMPASLGAFELVFHHDMAHVATPLIGLSLYALDVHAEQQPTRFANGCLAYARLGEAERTRLEGLQGLFVGNYTTITDHTATAREARGQLDPTWPYAVHPLVVVHPVTGARCLYANEMMTVAVLGLDTDDSDALLDSLFRRIYDPATIYEHHWHNQQLVVWDNLVLQHARRALDETTPRTLRRVVFGERTPWEEWPRHARSS
jgi:alpha-ketoglutarate-dependent taurine dioxygenase